LCFQRLGHCRSHGVGACAGQAGVDLDGREIDLGQGCHRQAWIGDKPDEQKIANFYAGYGANAAQFLAAMNSFAVSSKVNRGKQFMLRAGVDSTPSLVINGKYRVTGGRGWEDKLRIADHLIAKERAAAAGNGG